MSVSAVVVAAGSSRRMGAVKALLPFAGTTMIAHVVGNLLAAGNINDVVVVTGFENEKVAAAVAHLPIRVVHNPDFAQGEMISSVQRGLAALTNPTPDFLLSLGDNPGVQPQTIRLLIDVWQQRDPLILVPTFHGKRGHPLVFSGKLREQIDQIGKNDVQNPTFDPLGESPDRTLRDLVHRYLNQTTHLPVDDAEIIADLDTPEDYQLAIKRWEVRYI